MTPGRADRHDDEAKLYARYAARLRRIVARRVTTSDANVDDACSHAWLHMLRYQPARATLLSWLVRTATRQAVKLDRRSRRSVELDGAVVKRGCNPVATDAVLDVVIAREAILASRLRPRELELLAAQVAGYSYNEIANENGLTSRTVERQLIRARRWLRGARERQLRELDSADGLAPAAARARASR